MTLASTGDSALLTVSDHGIGIPANQITKVFEQFFRADNVSGSGFDPGGLGLGLYIARNVVQRHGGQIWTESGEGEGSTFFVELPIEQTVRGDQDGQTTGD